MSDFAETAYDQLKGRTWQQFKVAHVLDSYNGDLWCLDLDIHAPDDAALEVAIRERAALLADGELLPVVDIAAWRRYVAAWMDRRLMVECRSMKGGVLVAIRRES